MEGYCFFIDDKFYLFSVVFWGWFYKTIVQVWRMVENNVSIFNWDIVKGEVWSVFKEFFETSRFVKSLNSTFIVFVPKKEGALDLKDFRPISLVGSLYKLIAKLLANRLKKVVGQVVNKAQSAFVAWR